MLVYADLFHVVFGVLTDEDARYTRVQLHRCAVDWTACFAFLRSENLKNLR